MKKDPVSEFLETVGDEVEMTEAGKYRFVVTGMEFPTTATLETLKSHFNGRAMRRARVQRSNEQYDFTKHLPHIVPHKFMNPDKFLFCYLTGKTLPKNAQVVEKHVKGKRFGLRLKESLERKKELERVKEKRKAKAERAKNARRKGKKADANGDAMEEEDGEKNGDVAMEDGDANGGTDEFAKAKKNGFAGDGEALLEDTLAAALADSDDESGDGADASGGSEEEGEAKPKDDKMEEEAEESDDAPDFWTRGRFEGGKNPKKADADEEESDDEWATKKKQKPKKKGARAAAAAASGLKRKKPPALPKKMRQGARGRPASAGEREAK